MPNYGFDVRWSPADDEYVALCPSFPCLSAFGETPEEALAEVRDALSLYVEEYEADGVELPPAVEAETHSGQLRLRLPQSLHGALARQAEREGVSLNSLLVTYLSLQLGTDRGERHIADLVCKDLQRLSSHLGSLVDAVGGGFGVLQGQMQKIQAYQSDYVTNVEDSGGYQDPLLRSLTRSGSFSE